MKVFLSQAESLLPHSNEDVVSYISSASSDGKLVADKSHANESSRSEYGSDKGKKSSEKNTDNYKVIRNPIDRKKKSGSDETSVPIHPNALFDKQQANICVNLIDYSKKKGQELPSNDHIKKWIDKPQGYGLRRAIHDTLANIVREAKFDSHPPEASITKQLLLDILNLSDKCKLTNSP